MELILKAGLGNYIPLASTTVTLPCEVVVKVETDLPHEHLVLTVKSKAGTKDYDADKEANITDMLTEGKVLLTLSQFVGGQKICAWSVEPLVCVDANGDAVLQTCIANLESRLEKTEQTCELLKKAIAELYKMKG